MGKKSSQADVQHTNSQSQVDQDTKNRMGGIWDAGAQAGANGPGPVLTGAAGYNTGVMGAGATGAAALGGDPNATARLMNPYQQQVMDANNAAWGKMNAQTVNQENDLATKAGAFGGSRHGVAEGVALGNNAMAQGAQNAGLLSSGYQNAMGQAATAAGMGLNASGQNAQLGYAGVGNQALWNTNMLKNGFMGPTGQSSSGNNYGGSLSGTFGLF